MQPQNIEHAPKQFCESVTIGFSNEYVAMGMASGQSATVYALTPQHAKRLAQYLQHEVERFEKQFGEIDAQWSPNVKSPMQIDASGGEGENGK